MFNVEIFIFLFFFLQYCIFTISSVFIKRYLSSKHLAFYFAFSCGLLTFSLLLVAKQIYLDSQSWTYSFDNLVRGLDYIELNFSFCVDSLSLSFALLVSVIGTATNIYTLNYFRGEGDESRFLFWLNSFVLSMITLVFSGNFFTIFLGWELIGLSSFFLINFWHTRRGVVKSSFKAMTFNLVSDILLLSSFVSFFLVSKTSNCGIFLNLLILESIPKSSLLWFGTMTLVGCASIKSVQIVGHLWLPDSMEAPVPASSLIHSATLVSAGIYLLCRFNVLLVTCGCVPILITIGSITAAYGGVVAAAQTDMKKLLAYSTMSHCGFLWILASCGNLWITITYLYLHGLFKAATFYCAGSFIRNYNTQDTRWMGSGAKFLRLDSFLLIFCGANLAGLPFSIGVLYKLYFFKLILLWSISWWQIGLMFIGLASSLVYYYRLTNYAIFDFYKGSKLFPGYSILFTKIDLTDYRSTTSNHLLAVCILVFAALVTTYAMWWCINNNLIAWETIHEELSTILVDRAKVEIIYTNYYILFYTLYFVFFIMLCVVVCRPNIFAVESILTLLILVIFFGFLSVRCGVILWQKLIQ